MNERPSQRVAVGYSVGAARSRKSPLATLFCMRWVKTLGRRRAMTHIAIAEKLDGQSADWMEKVSKTSKGSLSGAHRGKGRLLSGSRFGMTY